MNESNQSNYIEDCPEYQILQTTRHFEIHFHYVSYNFFCNLKTIFRFKKQKRKKYGPNSSLLIRIM